MAILDPLADSHIESVIPPRSHRLVQGPSGRHQYKNRSPIERFLCRTKQFRDIATRYNRLAECFASFIPLCAGIWKFERDKVFCFRPPKQGSGPGQTLVLFVGWLWGLSVTIKCWKRSTSSTVIWFVTHNIDEGLDVGPVIILGSVLPFLSCHAEIGQGAFRPCVAPLCRPRRLDGKKAAGPCGSTALC